MYEFPAMEGFQTAEAVAAYLLENGIKVLRVMPLEDAKHIFTHKEWHMKGYMIRVDELATKKMTDLTRDWIYIEPWETQKKYPIPAAFSAYTRYLNIKLGKERYEETERSSHP